MTEGKPGPHALEPDDLLERAGAGDTAAFAALYDHTCATAYLLARCLAPADAEEVLRAAYLEVWRTASRFDRATSRAVPWILASVRQCARDRRHRPRHGPRHRPTPAVA